MNFAMSQKEPITHTTSPIYVGSSVIGMRYNNGVIIATDTRLNYGSMCKEVDIQDRIQQLTPRTIIVESTLIYKKQVDNCMLLPCLIL